MDEIKIIRYLLNEIEAEKEYNVRYEKEEKKAINECRRNNEGEWKYRKYMPAEIYRDKRYSVIKDNAKMIRRLTLKLYKEGSYE
jgi:hypothetical protein